jgi:hypothetical protein
VGELLLIRYPSLGVRSLSVVRISHVVINRTNVIMINSVLYVIEIVVSDRHSDFSKLIDELLLRILPLVLDELISMLNDFSVSHFSLIAVDLRQLLHLNVLLVNQMFFFLSQVSQVPGWVASPDLPRRDSNTFRNDSTSSNNSKAFNCGSSRYSGAHTNKRVAF